MKRHRIQSEELVERGPQSDREGPEVRPTRLLLGPPDVGEPARPVKLVSACEIAETVLAAQLQVVVIVEPKPKCQPMSVKGEDGHDEQGNRNSVWPFLKPRPCSPGPVTLHRQPSLFHTRHIPV